MTDDDDDDDDNDDDDDDDDEDDDGVFPPVIFAPSKTNPGSRHMQRLPVFQIDPQDVAGTLAVHPLLGLDLRPGHISTGALTSCKIRHIGPVIFSTVPWVPCSP